MIPHRLILKVTKFQLPPPKRFGTVVKNIFGGHHAHPPCQIGLSKHLIFYLQNIYLQVCLFFLIDPVWFSFGNSTLSQSERFFCPLEHKLTFCKQTVIQNYIYIFKTATKYIEILILDVVFYYVTLDSICTCSCLFCSLLHKITLERKQTESFWLDCGN